LPPEPDLLAPLKRYWGYDGFRPLQERIVRSLLQGHDIAVVMPTGGGKSLCYQLPAVVMGRTVVVISPLISLMQDQAAQLEQMGIPAAVLNSSLSPDEQNQVTRRAIGGAYRLLYLSPERLARQVVPERDLVWAMFGVVRLPADLSALERGESADGSELYRFVRPDGLLTTLQLRDGRLLGATAQRGPRTLGRLALTRDSAGAIVRAETVDEEHGTRFGVQVDRREASGPFPGEIWRRP